MTGLGQGQGLGSWRRRRAEARGDVAAGGDARGGPGRGFTGGRRKPRIQHCVAVGPQARGYELRISGSDLTAGAVPVTGRAGDRPLTEIRASSPRELTAIVDSCTVGDRLELDLGPFGAAAGTVASIEKPPRRPPDLPGPLDRLLSRLRDRFRGIG